MAHAVAEVIESSTRSFVAEVYREEEPPDFGSWVRVSHPNGTTLYGLVSHVELGSMMPNRQATALGMTEEELRREMPQVLELLRTTVRAVILAYVDQEGAVHQTLPPQPAGIHAPVHRCEADQVRALGAPYDFIRTLAQNPDPSVPVDDLLVAVLQQMARAQEHDAAREDALVTAGRTLSRLLDDDHERLHSILRRAR